MASILHFIVVIIISSTLFYLGGRLFSAGIIKFNDPKEYSVHMERDYDLILIGISLLILAIVLLYSLLV